MDNRLEKKVHFADLVKDARSVAGFSPFDLHINMDWLPRHFQMVASEVASFETGFFRVADTAEAETSMSRKCLNAIGENIKK